MLCAVILLLIPALGGVGLCGLLKVKHSLAKCYLAGILTIFGYCQLVYVPMAIFRVSFTVAANSLLIFMLALAVCGIVMQLIGRGVKLNVRESFTQSLELPEERIEETGSIDGIPLNLAEEAELDGENGAVVSALEELALRELVKMGISGDTPEEEARKEALKKAQEEARRRQEEEERIRKEKRRYRFLTLLSMGLMAAVIAIVCWQTIVLQHVDADDSRFVVNAMDMLRTDKLFLTNPATGKEVETFVREVNKDVVSPWSVLPAAIAFWIGTKPSVVFHNVLPVLLIILASFAYYQIGNRFFRTDTGLKCFFVFLVWVVNIFGYYSIYSSETFILTRGWQGKSVVASFGIPMMLYFLLCIYDQPNRRSAYVGAFAMDLALCFMSGMGIVIGAIMLGCYGLAYTIAKKRISVGVRLLLMCIPNAAYYLIYILLRSHRI